MELIFKVFLYLCKLLYWPIIKDGHCTNYNLFILGIWFDTHWEFLIWFNWTMMQVSFSADLRKLPLDCFPILISFKSWWHLLKTALYASLLTVFSKPSSWSGCKILIFFLASVDFPFFGLWLIWLRRALISSTICSLSASDSSSASYWNCLIGWVSGISMQDGRLAVSSSELESVDSSQML